MSTRSSKPRKARTPRQPRKTPQRKRPPEAAGEFARREALAEWRGVDLAPQERAWANKTRDASTLVASVLRELRLDARHAETEIVKVWNRLLDPNVACHAQPVGLKRGTLFIAVDSSVWLTELVRYRQHEILRRLQASFGSEMIKRLSFRLG
jgi:predicted nucleic acid-binding Zn ribbon protein